VSVLLVPIATWLALQVGQRGAVAALAIILALMTIPPQSGPSSRRLLTSMMRGSS
jgi:hypothetical protein